MRKIVPAALIALQVAGSLALCAHLAGLTRPGYFLELAAGAAALVVVAAAMLSARQALRRQYALYFGGAPDGQAS